MILIEYNGDICPVNQKYCSRNFVLSARYRNFKTNLGWVAKQNYSGKLLTGDLAVKIQFWYPKTMDIDAPIKPIFDALNNVVWEDDKQIKKLSVEKNKGDSYKLIIIIEAKTTI